MAHVSVIMNVRNGAASLRAALDSVLAQTFLDWELIVWDDCSTDDSAKIVAEYRDSRIRFFLSPEDATLGRARDLAIRQARGKWLAFLDQDDIWLPAKLQKQMALVEGQPKVGIIYGRTVMFSADGSERDFDHRHEFQPLPEGDIFEQLFIDSCFISMSSSVLLRSAVEQLGGIPEVIQTTPDYFLFLGVARHYRARAVQEVVCQYSLHPGGMSHSRGARIQQEAIWILDQWAHCLPPQLVARRRKIHSSVWAWEEMRHLSTMRRGLERWLMDGSVAYLLSRPFARAFRAIRRKVQHPYYVLAGEEGGAEKHTAAIAVQEKGSLPRGG